MITDDVLRRIMPNLKEAKRAAYLPFLQSAMNEFQINLPLREAAFIAQLAHESAELRYMEEIASGAAYEGRRDLGNTQAGDGKRFKGRGPIQLTGRANYKRYGELLGVDLINNPLLAATPEVGFRTASLYWQKNDLNTLADKQWFKTITKRINGGFNGLADRIKYYNRAKSVLGIASDAPADAIQDDGDDSAIPVFPRGSEADTPPVNFQASDTSDEIMSETKDKQADDRGAETMEKSPTRSKRAVGKSARGNSASR